MQAKEFFQRFVWGKFVPSVLFLAVGVITASVFPAFTRSTAAGYAYEYLTAFFALAMGGIAVADYFLGNSDNVAHLLFGAAAVSVGVYMCIYIYVKWAVVPIALGILIILRGMAEIVEAWKARGEGKAAAIVRATLAAIFAVGGLIACLRLFDLIRWNWVYTGIVAAAQAAAELVFVWRGGLFREEETLRFRPVKKDKTDEGEGSSGEGGGK